MLFATALKEGVTGPDFTGNRNYKYKNGEQRMITEDQRGYYEKHPDCFKLIESTGVVASTADGDLIGTDAKSVIKRGMPAKAYRAYYPLNQKTGQPKDYSGKGNDAFIRPNYEKPTFSAHANLAAFPGAGNKSLFYVANDTGNIYYWTGAAYVQETTMQRYANKAEFPATGTAGVTYYAADTALLWRWNGLYEEISSPAWSNQGYITTKSTHEDGFWMLPADLGVIADDEHRIISVKMIMPMPGATVFSAFTFGSGTVDGFYFDVLNSGKLQLFFNFADNVTRSFGVTNKVYADGTPHTLTIAEDRKTGIVYVFCDNELDREGYLIANNSMVFNTAFRPGIGGSLTSADTGITGKAGLWKDFHLITPKQFPLNLKQISMLMHTTTNYALQESDIVYRNEDKTMLTLAYGQSNETGRGQRPSWVTALGSPQSDAILGGVAPGGNQGWRSYWPTINELAGQEGWWHHTYNDGYGGSSLVFTIVGCIVNWVAGFEFVRGAYCLSDGGLWKANLPVGSGLPAGVIATTAPTGNTDVTTADGIPWIRVRTAGQTDVPGVVSYTSDLFDPMKCLRGVDGNGAPMDGRPGLSYPFDRKIVLGMWGQTDSSPTLNITVRQFADAYKQFALFFLTRTGTKKVDAIYLGLSLYTSAAGRDANYINVLRPGIALAISELNDPRVKSGPDMRALFGVLGTTTISGIPTLQTGDPYHGADGYYIPASKAIFNHLKAAGEYQ